MAKGKEAARSGGAVKAAKPAPTAAGGKKTKQNGIHTGSKGGRSMASTKPGESSSMAAHNTDITKDGRELANDELMQSLQRHDAFSTALLSLIPAHLYLAPESDYSEEESEDGEEGEEADATIKGKAKKRKNDKEAMAAERKARIREAKRAKLDPENQKTAIEIQQERAAKRAERQAASGAMDVSDDGLSLSFSMLKNADTSMHAGDTDGEEDDDDDDDDEDDDAEDDDRDSYETLPTSAKGSEELNDQLVVPSPPLGSGPPSILDLRARLQAKIQGMQAQRRAPVLGGGVHFDNMNGSAIGDDESTASTKDELLEERRMKRGDMREKRRKAMKERKRLEREQLGKKGAVKAGNDRKGVNTSGTTAPALFVSPGGNAKAAMAGSSTSIDGKGDIEFSALQFDHDDERMQKKSKHTLPSDPKVALAMLEARKRKDEARKAKREARAADDDGEGDESNAGLDDTDRTDNLRWSKVEAAAQGVKIRDDEVLLRKAAKKRDKIKAKSSSEWKKRARDLSSQQAARVKKRSDNIAARKTKSGGKSGSGKSVKGKALGGKPTGGRKARAGFEGKSRSFGDSGKSGRGGSSGGGGGRGGGRGGNKGGRGGGGGRGGSRS